MDSKTSQAVVVDQTLHGYSDGHRLLAGSKKLSKESLRTMLVLSDMSGPSMISGFDEYLTSYPLPEDNVLALAKTWYAPEMNRAGCVWTHTLLIDTRSLQQLQDPACLLALFRKPSGHESITDYSSTLELVPCEPVLLADRSDGRLARAVLSVLYLSAEPVAVVAETAAEHASPLLAIWAQQWPLSSERYRFCTGSIRFRETEGMPLDLQIIPSSAVRETRRRFPNCAVVDGPTLEEDSHPDNWLSLAVDDLFAHGDTDLRRFLWDFGDRSGPSRAVFRPYLEVFSQLAQSDRGEKSITHLLAAVAGGFPSPSSGGRLKVALFGDPAQRRLHIVPDEFDLVQALATTTYSTAFDPESLQLSGRATALWQSDWKRFMDEVLPSFGSPPNSAQDAIVSAITPHLHDDEICPVLQRFPHIFLPHIARSRHVATPAPWRCPLEIQSRLIDALKDAEPALDVRAAVVSAQLDAQNDVAADKTVAWLGVDAVQSVLSWLESGYDTKPRSIPRAWRQILGEQPTAVMDWITQHDRASISAILSVIYMLDPHCRAVHESGGDLWLRLAERTAAELHGTEAIDSSAFLLVVALTTRRDFGPALVGRSFPPVYVATAAGALTSKALTILQSEFAGIGWQWDRCRRLRRGLVEKFAENSWPTDAFLECTRDTSLLSAIYEMWGWGHKEVQFLRRVLRDAARGTTNAPQGQLDTVLRYRKWFS